MLFCSYLWIIAALVCLGVSYAVPSGQPNQPKREDEQTIRGMAEQAISRFNKGDLTAFDDFWAQDADYVSVDGRLVTGRDQIRRFSTSLQNQAPDRSSKPVRLNEFVF